MQESIPHESIPPAYVAWAQVCKRLRGPEIDSRESIPATYVSYPVAVRQTGLSYRPARLHPYM